MKQRARGAKWAAASAYGRSWGWGWDGARWLRIGASCALCFSIAGSAWAEDTTEPGAGRSAVPAPAKTEEVKLKGPAAKVDKTKRPGPEAVVAPVADAAELPLIAELHGKTEAAAVAAAPKLAALHTPRALNALLDSLALGVTPKVAGAVLDALATYKSATDAAPGKPAEILQVLTVYMHHRNPELRKHAVQGLAALITPVTETAAAGKPVAKAPVKVAAKPVAAAGTATPAAAAGEQAHVVPMLIAALSDSSSEVRAVAAESLGERREKSAEPALIKLLLRKDSAAPAALGKIGGADTARALGEMIGNVPDSFITETLGLLLLRPDFGPDPLRVEVVKTIGKLPGSQPIDILSDYLKETGKDKGEKARPSRTEANKIVEQRTAK